MKFLITICIGLVGIFAFGCRDPYEPSLPESSKDVLVVEGFVNTGGNQTIITLSRLNSYDDRLFKPEDGANVYIESDGGSAQYLDEIGNGKYTGLISLNENQEHRLKIITSEHKEYVSDPLEIIRTPAIEHLNWKLLQNGVQIFLSSDDQRNEVQFFLWEFEETWTFRSPYVSNIMYVKVDGEHTLQLRAPENLYPLSCYSKRSSSEILLYSTAHLSSSIIKDFPLFTVNNSTNRLRHKYSVLVKQYGLSQRAFQFWQILQKSTEGMGSIFDPMPSQLPTNIKCLTHPEEMVVGYVSAGTYSEKRLFIDNQELQNHFVVPTGYEECKMDRIPPSRYYEFESGSIQPLFSYPDQSYASSSLDCVDCRVRGTDIRPDFWEGEL